MSTTPFGQRDFDQEIEDAIQTACDRFVEKAEGISDPGQVYAWIRTTAHRVLSREKDHRLWELPVDPTALSLQELAAEEPGPEEETIEHEDEDERESNPPVDNQPSGHS